MNLPDFLIEYFDTLQREERESLKSIFEGDFSTAGNFTILSQKFIERDGVLFDEIFPKFFDYIENDESKILILRLHKQHLNSENDRLYKLLDKYPGKFYEIQIDHNENAISGLDFAKLRKSSDTIFNGVLIDILNHKGLLSGQDIINYSYVYYLDILYKSFLSERSSSDKYTKPKKCNNKLFKYYQSLNVDLQESDTQFDKYDLLSVNSSSEIIVGLPSRVLDKENNVQFMVDLPEPLLHLLKYLLDNALIGSLSLLVDASVPFETSEEIFILLGNNEPQKPVLLNDLVQGIRDCNITKYIAQKPDNDETFPLNTYSGRYYDSSKDSIWFFVGERDIYIEEILNEPILLEDCIVTQLVHIEYYMNGKDLYISHLDHEYIFYSYEEFDSRLCDNKIKGSARKRIKTLKIDSSNLPLVVNDDVLVLNTIIDSFFEKPNMADDFTSYLLGK